MALITRDYYLDHALIHFLAPGMLVVVPVGICQQAVGRSYAQNCLCLVGAPNSLLQTPHRLPVQTLVGKTCLPDSHWAKVAGKTTVESEKVTLFSRETLFLCKVIPVICI